MFGKPISKSSRQLKTKKINLLNQKYLIKLDVEVDKKYIMKKIIKS